MRTLLVALLLVTTVPCQIFQRPPRPPDPCRDEANGNFTTGSIGAFSNNLKYFLPLNTSLDHVVLIINGNSYPGSSYDALASFFAERGFLAAVKERSGTDPDSTQVIDSLAETFTHFGLSGKTPVGLVGHSVGGGAVVNAAVSNRQSGKQFNIQAVVTLAPNMEGTAFLLPGDTSAYLIIYGSQDEDMGGTGGRPREGFAGYDRSGTESSTVCNILPCDPIMDRTMIYIHGADHEGLIGMPDSPWAYGNEDVENEFISAQDQFCITRAYTYGLLDWKMRGNDEFEPLIRDWYRPPSISSIVSIRPDYMGNPADTPLRMYFQVSPPSERLVLEEFGFGGYTVAAQSPGMELEQYNYNDLANGLPPSVMPHYVRHLTNLLRVSWSDNNGLQMVVFDVPGASIDTTTFTHVAIRIGQLWGMDPTRDNPVNADFTVQLGLFYNCNGNGSDGDWNSITVPRNDQRYCSGGGQGCSIAHTGMSTAVIDLNDYEIDRANVCQFGLAFTQGTHGSIVFDNVELHRYD